MQVLPKQGRGILAGIDVEGKQQQRDSSFWTLFSLTRRVKTSPCCFSICFENLIIKCNHCSRRISCSSRKKWKQLTGFFQIGSSTLRVVVAIRLPCRIQNDFTSSRDQCSVMPFRSSSSSGRYTRSRSMSSPTSRRTFVSCMKIPHDSANLRARGSS